MARTKNYHTERHKNTYNTMTQKTFRNNYIFVFFMESMFWNDSGGCPVPWVDSQVWTARWHAYPLAWATDSSTQYAAVWVHGRAVHAVWFVNMLHFAL